MIKKLHIFLGATVADAASRPLHWVYDEKKLKSYIKEKKNLLVPEYLYEKHGIDSLQLATSQSYYAKNPKKYVPIFKLLENHLKKLKDSIQESMRASEEE